MKNVINLTPEEKFNRDVLRVLKKIKERLLYTKKDELIEYQVRFYGYQDPTVPPPENEAEILEKLQEWGAIRIRNKKDVRVSEYTSPEAQIFYLGILQPAFDKFCKKWEEIDENPWLSEESKIIQRKKLFKKQRKEDEIRAKEIRRQFEELNEKQKAFEELGRQIPSRIQKDFDVKQYGEVIKKIDEQAEPIRRVLKQLDAVYSGSVQNSLIPVLQRLTESIKPIGEQMKRLKSLFEYPEYPKEAFISSDVIRARQGAETISKLENIEALLQGLLSKNKKKPTQVEIIKPEEFKVRGLEKGLEKIAKLKKDEKPVELFTNNVIPDRTAEIEKDMNEARRWEVERWEREKLHKQQLKQDRILRTPVDKYTHALDLIIERAEYAEDGNSFSIEFYDFNFEQMIGSKMLEKFLTEIQKDGCFEKYTRTNYAGGTRFGFIKPDIKKLKAFKEKREKQEIKTGRFNEEVLKTEQLLDKLERDIKKKAKEQEQFEIKLKDRQIWINEYFLSKPHAVGSNLEFFEYIRSQPQNIKIERNKLPDFGGLALKQEVKNKSFIKILNELGFKSEILKAFFPKRGKNMLIYRGDKITKKDLEKAWIRIPLFLKELELAHLKNNPE